MPSTRVRQIESALQRAIAQVLQRDLSDPRIEGLISVTGVEVSADLKHAKVSVSVLPAEKQARTLGGLRHAARRIQALVHRHVELRATPELRFIADDSLKRQAEVYDAIRRGVERSGQTPTPDGNPPPTDPPSPATP